MAEPLLQPARLTPRVFLGLAILAAVVAAGVAALGNPLASLGFIAATVAFEWCRELRAAGAGDGQAHADEHR